MTYSKDTVNGGAADAFGIDDAIRVLARALAPELAPLIAAELRVADGGAIVDARTAAQHIPGMTPRAFADAAREGRFRTFKSGRRRVARLADVLAGLGGSPGPAAPPPQKSKPKPKPKAQPSIGDGRDDERAELAQMGVKLRRARVRS